MASVSFQLTQNHGIYKAGNQIATSLQRALDLQRMGKGYIVLNGAAENEIKVQNKILHNQEEE